MIPAGYMYKKVALAPHDVAASSPDIYSVSGCISKCFAEYIPYWRHNGYWLFDSPQIIQALAAENAIDLSGLTLFYYEIFEHQYEAAGQRWLPFGPESSIPTNVHRPQATHLEGYDVVTFAAQTNPECSPLSCNSFAANVPVNRHCLFDSFEEAKRSVEGGLFNQGEPGPFRIFAVHTVAQ
jgi:hypothetical protein